MTAPPRVRPDERTVPAETPPRLGLSATQVIATALAAVTATVVASFFGVTGTVVGAGISSVLSVVGTAVYGHSLRKTRERMRVVVPVTARRRRPSASSAYLDPPRPTYQPYAQARGTSEYGPVRYSRPRRRSAVTRLAFGAVAIFVAVLAVVTGVEAVAQRPLSDLLRGNDNVSGTTLFGNHQRTSAPARHSSSSASKSPAPTVTRTVTRTATSTAAPPSTSGTSSAPAPSTPPPSSPSASPSAANRSGAEAPLG